MTITRAIVIDLWPLYESGDASAETRAAVEECLREDPELAQQLRRETVLPPLPVQLPPDHQARTLTLTRRRLRGIPWLLFFAMMFSMLAFGRIVADTSWDVSPRNFIVTASMAAVFWTAWLVTLWRMRARILFVPGTSRT